MALRWPTATGGLLLMVTLLGVGCAQGSGSRAHTGQTPLLEVLGTVEAPLPETLATAAPVTTTTVAPLPAAPTATVAALPVVAVVGADPDAGTHREPGGAAGPAQASADDVGALALGRIGYPWRTRLPGWDIVFLDGRPSLRGVTLPTTKRIEIYVRSSDTADSLARVVAHELGHAVDVTLNDALDRSRWRTARGVEPAVPWWPDAAASDFATMGGDFAEAFAAWQTGVASLSTVAGPPTAEQLALLAVLAS